MPTGYTGSKAQVALGTQISIGTSPTLIGEVKSIKQTGNQWDTEETTNLQSTAKEFLPTLQDSGEYQIDGNRVAGDAGQVALEAAFAAGSLQPFKVTIPKSALQTTTGDSYAFTAMVLSREFSYESTKVIPFSVKLKVSGPITFTAGS